MYLAQSANTTSVLIVIFIFTRACTIVLAVKVSGVPNQRLLMNERTWTFASPTKTELDIYMTSFTWVKKQLTSVVYKVSVSCSDDESEAHIVVPLKFSFICRQFLNQFRGDSKLDDAAFFYPSTMPLLKLGGKKISCENKDYSSRKTKLSFLLRCGPADFQ